MRLHSKHGVNPTIPVCWLCGNEKGEVALLGAAYKEQAPMRMCIDQEPCEECRGMMQQGILLIRVRDGSDPKNPYRTGQLAVIKEEAARRIFDIGDSRAAFVEDEAWEKIGLPQPEEVVS